MFDNTDFLNSTIRKYARGGFIDNVCKRVPLFNWMRQKGCLSYWDGAGTKVSEEVIKELPAYMQALAAYEEIILKPCNGTQLVDFPRKELVWPIVISYGERDGNQSKEKMIDLLKTRMKIVELGAAQDFEQMVLGDGTSQGGKVMLGLEAFIPNTQTAGTLCGITKSTNTWIQCPTSAGTMTAAAFDNLRAKMSYITNTLTFGTVRPELYLTTQTVYEGYESLSYGKWTPTTKESYDLGFNGDMTFRGKPVVFGDYVTSAKMYVLNSDSLKLRCKGLKSSKDSPFTIDGPYDLMPKQKAVAWLMSVEGALTCNMFRQIGALHTIS
ncbi:MAG: phage major capsid protein [Thermoanaerobaculaceae bacterium]|nr:phage major capsid protein [Thermoanaerobaculaceae bacterium]